MIHYNSTKMGRAYGSSTGSYLDGLAQKRLDQFEIRDSVVIAANRVKNQLPKASLPYVISSEVQENALRKTLVMVDLTGVRDSEEDLRFNNAILTALWEDAIIAERFTGVRKFATKAYMNWASRNFVNRHNLEMQDKIEFDLMLAIYFYCAGSTPEKLLNKRNYKVYRDLAEITGYGERYVEGFIDRFKLDIIDTTFTLGHAIELIKTISPDLKSKVSIEAVMGVLAYSWYGEGGVFYCNLAIEYPPMFIALLYSALVDKTASKSRLTKNVMEFSVGRNKQQGELFVRMVTSLIKENAPKAV